ncbi:unnamed protein product [Paramecium pentaurelia]|uniref:Insulysin n=1 Tax=Paramecium pentaurelia TaxID=43138 RepID=A0A8S1XK48_9CILI|nr:unnamed protein product [Paramecium pentaurelia]
MEEETQGLVESKIKLNNAKGYRKIVSPIFNTIMLIIVFCLIAFMLTMMIQQQKLTQHDQTQFLQKQQIKKPMIDNNVYEYITLENGLSVLLIQNNDAIISQVALSVKAGSFQEPANYGGLAHLLEHMLFVGSHTYPDPNYFNTLIYNNGGTNNAYTDNYETNYYFTIQNSALHQGLDVFSHFFIDPILDQKMVEKEVNAVNNEYEIITDTDEWKIEALLQILSEKSHPFSQFSIGNLNTLLKDEISEQLKQFFNQAYSSNLMSLVIESSLPITELKTYLKSFEKIKNNNLVEPSCEDFGSPIQYGTQLIQYKSNSDVKRVYMTHQLSDVQQQYKTKAIELINNLIQSSKGVKEYLIQKNLIIDMSSGVLFNDHNGCFNVFALEFQVYNLNDYDQIIQSVFSYYFYLIQTLFDDQGDTLVDNDKLRSLYDDYKKTASLKFNFKENIIEDIQEIAHNLNIYGFHDVLSRKYLYEDYDPELIYFYLTDLLDIDNLNVFLGDSQLNHPDVQYDKVNRINYVFLDIPDTIIQKIQTYDEIEQPKFQLPSIHKYQPNDLKMKSFCKPYSQTNQEDPYEDLQNENMLIQRNSEMVFSNVQECLQYEHQYEELYPLPEYLFKSSIGKLWWKLDRSYKTPAIFMGMKIDKINFQFTLKQQVLLKVFQSYTSTLISQHLESAFQNNYNFKFQSSPNHIIFNIYGWNDKFFDFIEDSLTFFIKQQIDLQIYDQTLKTLINQYNQELQSPLYSQIRNHFFLNTLIYGYYEPKQILQELKNINIKDYEQFHSQLFKGTNFQLYLTGNVLREEALSLFKSIEKKLFGKPKHLDYNPIYSKILKLSNNYIIPYAAESNENNGATFNYYIFGNRNRKQFAIMNILKGTFDSSAFNYLRTDLQLGYLVSAKFTPLECLDGAAILVQGSAKTPYQVNQYIEDFLQFFYKEIEKMTDFDIEELKKAAIQQLRQKEKTLFEKGLAYWDHIQNNDFIFEEKEITIDQIDLLKKEDILSFLNTAFKKSSKISIQLYGKHMLKGMSIEEFLKNQNPIKSFSDLEEKISDKEKIKVGAMLYQCSFKLGQI